MKTTRIALAGALLTGLSCGAALAAPAQEADATAQESPVIQVPAPPPAPPPLPPAATPEPATAADYYACDGYPAPKPKKKLKPGEKQASWRGWGGVGPQHGVRVLSFSVRGSAACERTLADPMMVPEFWGRRASLLRARALHEMGEKGDDTALETLDAVDALYAANSDGDERAAAKLANDALRAVALYRSKKTAEAETLLVSINARRPFSSSVLRLTSAIRMLFDTDRAKRIARLREQAPFNPGTLRLMLMVALQGSDFENALLYADQVSFDLPKGRGGWTLVGDADRKYTEIQDRAVIRGARAYALLALGRIEESARELKGARDEVSFAVEPPAPLPNGKKHPKRVQQDYERRVAAGDRATASLDDWSRAIAMRMRASKMTMKAMAEEPERPKADALVILPDLLAQVRTNDLADARAIDTTIEELAKINDAQLTKALQLNFTDLTKMLPRPESDAGRPKMRNEGSNFWRTDLEGYRVMAADDPALVNVRLGSLQASPAMVEEATLLIAANHVAGLGKDAFVIESAQLITRSTTSYGMYIGSSTYSSGHEYRLLIRPISLSGGEEPSRHWRAIKVAEVQAALAAKYPPTP